MSGKRLLHTMIRVGDLDRSIKFYTECVGMKFLRKCDYPEDEFTLVFLGFGTEMDSTVLELTYNYGVKSYEHGGAYGHIAIAVDDVKKAISELKAKNIPVDYEDDRGFMAFIRDPDGYQIELLNEKMMLEKAEKQMKDQGTL